MLVLLLLLLLLLLLVVVVLVGEMRCKKDMVQRRKRRMIQSGILFRRMVIIQKVPLSNFLRMGIMAIGVVTTIPITNYYSPKRRSC